jgi:hypothetical protein
MRTLQQRHLPGLELFQIMQEGLRHIKGNKCPGAGREEEDEETKGHIQNGKTRHAEAPDLGE